MTSFAASKAIGIKGEAVLDAWLSRFYRLWAASPEQERAGIDRLAIHYLAGRKFTFQYKTDTRAFATGNAFVETCSVWRQDRCQEPGWAYDCEADYLFYLVIGGHLYICRPGAIKSFASGLWQSYPSRDISNRDWKTQGLLVPLPEFQKAATIVIQDFEQWATT